MRLLILLALLLSACGPALPLGLTPTPLFRESTLRVIDAVNRAANSKVLALATDGILIHELPVAEGDDICGDFDLINVIRIKAACTEAGDAILVHEVGHVFLGPDHDPNPYSVMYTYVVPNRTLEYAAESLVEELRERKIIP